VTGPAVRAATARDHGRMAKRPTRGVSALEVKDYVVLPKDSADFGKWWLTRLPDSNN
jgi:hypothetical protein